SGACTRSTRSTRRGSVARTRSPPERHAQRPAGRREADRAGIAAHVPDGVPDEGDGAARGRLRAARGRSRAAPRARLPSLDHRDAHVEDRPLSLAHRHHQREVARAAGRALLGALQAPDGDDGPVIVEKGRVDYMPAWQAMQAFNRERGATTADEIWLL